MLSNSATISKKTKIEDQHSCNGKADILKWHQFHLWIGSKDFAFLEQVAEEQEESVARIIRRLIRQYRLQTEQSRR